MRVQFPKELCEMEKEFMPYLVLNGLEATIDKTAPNYEHLIEVFEKWKVLSHKLFEEAEKLCW